MLPPDFVEASGHLYKAFSIASKILMAFYNETELEENTNAEILRLRKYVIRKQGSSGKTKRKGKHENNTYKRPNDLHKFLKMNIKRYRKKYYYLKYVDVFRIALKRWLSVKKNRNKAERAKPG